MNTKTQLTNRILSLVLALVLMVGMLPTTSFTASAAETEYDGVIGELYYKVDQENNITTIFGNGALSSTTALANVMTSNVVIEEGVTSIGNTAFRGLSSLEGLTVKGDVTIGNYAFQGCASLETVALLSRQKVEEHIYFDVNVQDLPKTARTTATYPEIKAYIKDKYGLNVTSLNIAQVKEKHGFEKRENYNKGKEGHRVPNCPPEKEKAIEDAFKHFGML